MRVACILPIAETHLAFRPLALASIARQILPAGIELATYEDVNTGPTGAARNRCCQRAIDDGCEVAINVDVDDPLVGTDSFAKRIAVMLANPAAQVCGTSLYYSLDLLTGKSVEQTSKRIRESSMCFRLRAWQLCQCPNTSVGECSQFLANYVKTDCRHERPRDGDLRASSAVDHGVALAICWPQLRGRNRQGA